MGITGLWEDTYQHQQAVVRSFEQRVTAFCRSDSVGNLEAHKAYKLSNCGVAHVRPTQQSNLQSKEHGLPQLVRFLVSAPVRRCVQVSLQGFEDSNQDALEQSRICTVQAVWNHLGIHIEHPELPEGISGQPVPPPHPLCHHHDRVQVGLVGPGPGVRLGWGGGWGEANLQPIRSSVSLRATSLCFPSRITSSSSNTPSRRRLYLTCMVFESLRVNSHPERCSDPSAASHAVHVVFLVNVALSASLWSQT
jgi:hypothetical protein